MSDDAVTADLLLQAYAYGVFPMAEDADDEKLFWVDPRERGIIPLKQFHIPRRLKRTVRQDPFEVRVDHAFLDVMKCCSESVQGRDRTWINDQILDLYGELFERGHAHSVECWQGEDLVGGLYGVSIGGAFFGESMFSRATDASKVALVHLVGRLSAGGFTLLDTQFLTEHLAQFGTVEISRDEYRELLRQAITQDANFYSLGRPTSTAPSGTLVLQSITQTS